MEIRKLYSLHDQESMLLCTGNHFAVVKELSLELVIASSAFITEDTQDTDGSYLPNITSSTKKIADSDLPADYIRCVAYDPVHHKLALVSNDKKLWIWDTDLWALVESKDLVKRGSAIVFSSSNVIVSDKFGDVYNFSLLDSSRTLMMGHVSQVTDLVLTKDYLITSDVDEHIRVSNYPNAYDIHTYCLGHESFLSKLCIIDDYLVSGGGDPYICLWDYKSGTKLVSKEINNESGITVMTNYKNTLMITTEKSSILTFWNVESSINFIKNVDLKHVIIDAAFDSKGQVWASTCNGVARIINDEISWINFKIGSIKSFTYESVLELKKTFSQKPEKSENPESDLCGKILCKLEGSTCPFCNSQVSKENPYIADAQTSLEFHNALNQKLKLLKLDASQQHKIIHDVASDFDPLASYYSPWISKTQKASDLKEWEKRFEAQSRSAPKWYIDLENRRIVYEEE